VFRAVDALTALGGQVLVLHPGATPSDSTSRIEQLALSRESIAAVAVYCASQDVLVALENPPPYELAGTTVDMEALYRHFAPDPTIQACFDTGHAHITPEGVMSIMEVAKDILLVHLSDNAGESDDHLMPGSGTIAWSPFFALLRQRGFNACLMLELTDTPRPDQVLANGWAWMTESLERV
jgi:sugar phosphate isomerase/epimerase